MSENNKDRPDVRRDTVVVGASSGGIQAISRLLEQLPADFPASVFIVQHISPRSPGQLITVLQRSSELPLGWGEAAEPIETGRVYVAPPDLHLVLDGDLIQLSRGPRENRTRPAINPLFRTAAASRGSRVIAVLLTGLLDDGVAGFAAVRQCGGVTIAQDPEDAEYPDMPENAIAAGDVDHVLPLDKIGLRLRELVDERTPQSIIPDYLTIEAALSRGDVSGTAGVKAIGEKAAFSCPDCGGPLWKVGSGGATVYRCHVGHALSARLLVESQDDQIEYSLWSAIRTLEERAASLNKLAEDAKGRRSNSAAEFEDRAIESSAQAEHLREYVMHLSRRRQPAQGSESEERADVSAHEG